MYNYPYIRPGVFSRWADALRGFNFSGFLDGTQKTLGVINQAIPIVNQVKPMVRNARTMFKIAGELKKPSEAINTTNISTTASSYNPISNNKPIFYM